MTLALDMYQTVAVAVIVLTIGAFLKKKINFLETFCIPAPVVAVRHSDLYPSRHGRDGDHL